MMFDPHEHNVGTLLELRRAIRRAHRFAAFFPMTGASQQDVADIETAVGSDADAASASGSVHAKIKELRTLVDDLETRIGVPAGSLTALVDDLETRLGTPASGTVASQIGSDADASSATGSVHAKLKDIKASSGSVINSIQRGTIAISNALSATATITSVTLTKAVAHHLGQDYTSTSIAEAVARLELTNATTLTAQRQGAASAAITTVGYAVIEYK